MTLRLNKEDKYFNNPLTICQKAYTNARRFYGIKQGYLLVIFYIDELKWKLMILIGLSKLDLDSIIICNKRHVVGIGGRPYNNIWH